MAAQPMYQQIAEDLRKQIDSGLLEPGSQLPTELELRERYDASRNTIRDAVKRLISQGLVETRPGQGIFVTRKVDPFVTVLTADPKTGFGGGEGTTYLSQVSAGHPETVRDHAQGRGADASRGDQRTAAGVSGHAGRQQAPGALHR